MSVLDELKKLDDHRARLIADGKKQALQKAEEAIAELKALGFNYSLTEGTTVPPSPRRKGVRQQVLDLIKGQPDGIRRADIFTRLNATEGPDKSSVANAIAALKKDETITATNGIYRA